MPTLSHEQFMDRIMGAFGPLSDEYTHAKTMLAKSLNWDDLMQAKLKSGADPDDSAWKALARQGRLIDAIKSCRALHGFSLIEARDCVESYRLTRLAV